MKDTNSITDSPVPHEQVNQLTSNGFLLLKHFDDSQLVASVLAVSERRAQAIRDALGGRDIGIGSAAGFEEIVQRSPGRWDVPISMAECGLNDCDLPWWSLIATVLGEDAEHSFSGVVSSEPSSPAQSWHTDSPHLAAEHLGPHAINVMMALHDVHMEMGPTECARGSHFLTNHLSNPALKIDELVYQHLSTTPALLVKDTDHHEPKRSAKSLAAGTCLIFDDRLLHRGLANRSKLTRHIAYFSYRQKGYVGNTHFEAQRSVFDAAD